jgi:hypothetical protein
MRMPFAPSALVLAAALALAPASLGQEPPPAAPQVETGIDVPVPGEKDDTPPAYNYEVRGRRDPFRSLLLRTQDDRDRQRPPGIAGMLVEELSLQGTIRTRQGWIAMMRGGDNRSYLLRKGTTVFDGEVLEIGSTEVVFRQNVNDPTSPKPFRDVVKALALQAKP